MSNKNNHKDFLDSDADGLSDEKEKSLGTNPNEKDTDHDNLGDYQEANVYGTDPNNPDTDNDGVSDGDEVKRGLNPRGKGKLRDLFIPHEGNNYHPNSLHPKRVLFHAGAVLAIKAIVIISILGLPTTAWLTPDVLQEQQQKIIELTNVVRKNLGISELIEKALLNEVAFNKAQDMLIGQYFAHISPEKKSLSGFLRDSGYSYSVAGENLAMGFANAESVVNAWVKSPTHYANIIDSNYQDIGVGLTSGAFNGHDTTLVAQYFGTKFMSSTLLPNTETVNYKNKEQLEINLEKKEQTLGASEEVDLLKKDDLTIETPLSADNILVEPKEEIKEISIDKTKSLVYVEEKKSEDGTIVRAKVYIIGATEAEIVFNNNHIPLIQDLADLSLWTGSTIVFETKNEEVFNPVVLPSVKASDALGNKIIEDISWNNIIPVKPSLTTQYFFIKNQNSGIINSLMIISSWYFKALLAIIFTSLILMVFIQIKKQHPKHIASGLGLIALLVLLILF